MVPRSIEGISHIASAALKCESKLIKPNNIDFIKFVTQYYRKLKQPTMVVVVLPAAGDL